MLSSDEESMCQTLKCLVEEFGPEYVIVHAPRSWNNGKYNLGPVSLKFDTENTLFIELMFNGFSHIANNILV
jgi:hypothetical protein